MSQLSSKLDWNDAQNKWSAVLNPIIANPMTNPRILTQISLINGSTTINHGLQRQLQGWIILDQNASAVIYRSQPFNDNTLTLTSNAAVVVTIGVF